MTDEELNHRFADLSSALARLADAQVVFQSQMTQSMARLEENQGQLTRSIVKLEENQGQLTQSIVSLEETQGQLTQNQVQLTQWIGRLDRDQLQLAQIEAGLAQGQEELRRNVMETREDMAQFTEWTEIMTHAVEELRASRARHERFLEEMRQQQAESDQRFDVLLQEIRFLIRQQYPPTQEEDS